MTLDCILSAVLTNCLLLQACPSKLSICGLIVVVCRWVIFIWFGWGWHPFVLFWCGLVPVTVAHIFQYCSLQVHDDVIKWKPLSALLAFCAGNSPVTGEFPAQRPVTRSFDVFFFICARINGLGNNGNAGDLRRHFAHYNVIVMKATLNHRAK